MCKSTKARNKNKNLEKLERSLEKLTKDISKLAEQSLSQQINTALEINKKESDKIREKVEETKWDILSKELAKNQHLSRPMM